MLPICRNKGIENVITIDLHGQHVKQAMKYVKSLLLLGTYVPGKCLLLSHLMYSLFHTNKACTFWFSFIWLPAVQTLRLITGCGSHGAGKSKVKQTVWVSKSSVFLLFCWILLWKLLLKKLGGVANFVWLLYTGIVVNLGMHSSKTTKLDILENYMCSRLL